MEEIKLGETILAAFAFLHSAAQDVSHQLLPIADAKHGNTALQQTWIYRRASRVVDAGGSSRDDHAFSAHEVRGRRFTGSDFGVDSQIAYFARDQVTVLPARIENGYLWTQFVRWRATGSTS